MLTEEQQDDLFEKIRTRIVTVFSLSLVLYEDIVADFREALFDGYGGGFGDFDDDATKKELLRKLDINSNRLAAAKNYQQTNDMGNFILDEKGVIRSFSDFRVDAQKVFDKYNETWLQTEFETIVAQGQAASSWVDAQKTKATFPFIKYQTAADEKVRPQHAEWDNIVRKVDDPFWDSHYPPNGFNCRCIAVEVADENVTSLAGVSRLDKEDIFAINPGKDQFLFKTGGLGPHPYFEVPANHEALKNNNFGLPLPAKSKAA